MGKLKYYWNLFKSYSRIPSPTQVNDQIKYGNYLYHFLEPWAHLVRTIFQMLTRIVTATMIVIKILAGAGILNSDKIPTYIIETPTLGIVGNALTYSAAFELSYMLFTPGPDEAIDPVILGLASAVMLIISDTSVDWTDAVVAPLLRISIALLFYIEKEFISNRR